MSDKPDHEAAKRTAEIHATRITRLDVQNLARAYLELSRVPPARTLRLEAQLEAYCDALNEIAAWKDTSGKFDEPNAVRISRDVLGSTPVADAAPQRPTEGVANNAALATAREALRKYGDALKEGE